MRVGAGANVHSLPKVDPEHQCHRHWAEPATRGVLVDKKGEGQRECAPEQRDRAQRSAGERRSGAIATVSASQPQQGDGRNGPKAGAGTEEDALLEELVRHREDHLRGLKRCALVRRSQRRPDHDCGRCWEETFTAAHCRGWLLNCFGDFAGWLPVHLSHRRCLAHFRYARHDGTKIAATLSQTSRWRCVRSECLRVSSSA